MPWFPFLLLRGMQKGKKNLTNKIKSGFQNFQKKKFVSLYCDLCVKNEWVGNTSCLILRLATHITRSPTIKLSRRNATCLPMMNCWFSAPIVLIPFEDPLKFHSVIPPSQTLVTPVDVNNTPRGGIPTDFHNNDRCLKDMCRVFHLTDVSLQVSSRNGLTDRLMALFFFFFQCQLELHPDKPRPNIKVWFMAVLPSLGFTLKGAFSAGRHWCWSDRSCIKTYVESWQGGWKFLLDTLMDFWNNTHFRLGSVCKIIEDKWGGNEFLESKYTALLKVPYVFF